MRPRQWTKNVFVLAALVFDRQLFKPQAVLNVFAGMVLFCLLSSVVYIINDILDVEADRNHPDKKHRPIASGALPIPVAAGVAFALLVITLPVSFLLNPVFGWVGLTYLVVNFAYSTRLKHVPVIDVLLIAAGFVLRVAAGVSLIQVERFSPWLYVVTTLLALFIGFGKRRAEVALQADGIINTRKVLEGYTLDFLDQLITIVSSTTVIAYSLYTFSAPNLPENHSMMLTIPFVLYGIFRYLYLVKVKQIGGAPEELVLKDRPLQATILLWGLSIIIIFYLV